MRAPWTLWLYVTREVLLYAGVGLATIAIVMLSRSLADVLDKLVGAGFSFADLAVLARLLATSLLVYALPVALLFGVLLAVGRLSSDVEITAMRACGVGIGALAVPVLALGLLFSALTLPLSLEVEPAARRELTSVLQSMFVRGASIESGRFNRVGDRTFYVDERAADGSLRGVVIADTSDPERPFTVFAERGELDFDAEAAVLTLRLRGGDVHVDLGKDERYQRVAFQTLEYRIDVAAELGAHKLMRPREMSLGTLRETVARIEAGTQTETLRSEPPAYAAQLESRWALPAAPALFALVGLPLGMWRKRGARSWGVIFCAALAFGYYALHSFSELLIVERGAPAAVAWLANGVLLVAGLVALSRAGRPA